MALWKKAKPVESTAEPIAEIKAEQKEAEDKFDEIMVVREIPTIQARFAKLPNGRTAKLITTEEALTEILNAKD